MLYVLGSSVVSNDKRLIIVKTIQEDVVQDIGIFEVTSPACATMPMRASRKQKRIIFLASIKELNLFCPYNLILKCKFLKIHYQWFI
jgi:hypothetical protein